MTSTVFEVVSRKPDGTFQLFGTNGLVAHTDGETVIEAGVELRPGAYVLADTAPRGTKNVAQRVKPYENPIDPETRLRRILAAYREAFIEVDVGDVASFAARGDLEAAVWKKVERSGPVYPRCLWSDPGLQLSDARALLQEYGVSLPEMRLPHGDVHETCRAIVEAANVALANAGDERRFFAIEHCPIRDPIARWILVTPRQLHVLVSRGILTSSDVQRRQAERAHAIARPSIARRAGAKLLDGLVCGGTIFGFSRHVDLGWAILLGYTWFMLSDWSGSFGKWVLGLRAVDHQTGRPCTPLQSLLRNLPFAASLLPRPFSAFAFALQVAECLKASKDPEGRRWGDLLGKTVVMPRLPR